VKKRWRWGVPHVDHQVDRHGHARWWYRRGKGARLAVLPMPGTPHFLAAWKAADEAAERGLAAMPVVLGAGRTRPGSFSAALVAYYASTAWTIGLAEGSREWRRRILEKLRADFGTEPLSQLQRKHIQALMRKLKPNAQKNLSTTLKHFFKFALSIDLIDADPMVGVARDKAERSDGHIAWTEDDLAKFRAHWPLGTRQRLAVEIMVNLGLRRSDACRIGPHDVRGGRLVDFEPKKTSRTTGKKLTIPVRPELAEAIAAMNLVSTRTYLVTDKGRGEPFKTEQSFGSWMRKTYDAAGLPDCANHGLRKLAAIRLALAGCSAPQLCNVFGWSTLEQAQVYIDQAEQILMADQAMARLEAHQNANRISPTL
jgi:integrase